MTLKERLKKKLIKLFEDSQYTYCSICRKVIPKYDIEDLKFEYCKSQFGEHYIHSSCVKLKGAKQCVK